jgi:hypothetical protein
MNSRSIARNLALMAVSLGAGILTFSENVRTVQVLGLVATGVAAGACLARAILAMKAGRAEAAGR